MAKRKRLAPAKLDTEMPPLETKSMTRLSPHPAPPIAQVSGDASSAAALEELSETLRRARAEGRMITDIPLDQITEDYLVRDRVAATGDEDMQALMASIKTRGQQTPIELEELGKDRYGLISGWRRLQVLKALGQGTARAIITPPRDATDAYVAMIEENEIRVGLSYFERARIVVKSVEAGVYDRHKTALQTLFSSASRAKRSKIKSFIPVVEGLEDILKFPTQMGERLGLQLSKALTSGEEVLPGLWSALVDAKPATAEDEQATLASALKGRAGTPARKAKSKNTPAETPRGFEAAPGITLNFAPEKNEIVLQGENVTLEMRSALKAWLRERYS